MSISNEELVQKAVITTDAIASAGKLNPAQSDKFIDFVIQETVLKDNARIVRFRNEDLEIDKIGVGQRVALPKAEAQDPARRRGINTSKVTLTPKEIMVPFEISDNFKENNIEGDASEQTIIRLMATRLANNLEELYVGGDSLGPSVAEEDIVDNGSATDHVVDSYMAMFDGWERLADGGNLVDAAGDSVGLGVFSQMIRAMPTKFRRNKKSLRYYLSSDLWQLYVEKLAARATAMGDMATEGKANTPFGIPAVEVPLMKFQPDVVEHLTFTGSGSTVNLRYGPVANVVVTPSTLGSTPTTPFVLTTDYTVDEAAGTVTHAGGGSAIGTTATVKITYSANPQVLLTHQQNYIIGIGRDIRIEKDRNIYKSVNEYAITAKIAVEFEEDTALVKAFNIGTGI